MKKSVCSNLVEIAKAMIGQHQQKRCFHTAFIMRKSKIVSIGWNQTKTHPNNRRYPYRSPIETTGIHAEYHAIIKSRRNYFKNFKDCKMIVLRINNNGVLDDSCPCQGCQAMLRTWNFKAIYYSTKEQSFARLC